MRDGKAVTFTSMNYKTLGLFGALSEEMEVD